MASHDAKENRKGYLTQNSRVNISRFSRPESVLWKGGGGKVQQANCQMKQETDSVSRKKKQPCNMFLAHFSCWRLHDSDLNLHLRRFRNILPSDKIGRLHKHHLSHKALCRQNSLFQNFTTWSKQFSATVHDRYVNKFISFDINSSNLLQFISTVSPMHRTRLLSP